MYNLYYSICIITIAVTCIALFHSEFVERVLSDQDEGTFVVFRPAGRSGELTLAIR